MKLGEGVTRARDVAVVALLIVPAILVAFCVASLVWMLIGRPLLFQQSRIGLGNQPFTLIKFRTMSTGPGSDAERLTKFGRWLRSTSLDELPSLWNVLRGELSLVGPRPLLPEYLPLYNERQLRRHEVRPGITGWAQVNGRNAISWQERLEMDVWYVENRSHALDFRILLMTFSTVLRRSGISQPGEATMEPFKGGDS